MTNHFRNLDRSERRILAFAASAAAFFGGIVGFTLPSAFNGSILPSAEPPHDLKADLPPRLKALCLRLENRHFPRFTADTIEELKSDPSAFVVSIARRFTNDATNGGYSTSGLPIPRATTRDEIDRALHTIGRGVSDSEWREISGQPICGLVILDLLENLDLEEPDCAARRPG